MMRDMYKRSGLMMMASYGFSVRRFALGLSAICLLWGADVQAQSDPPVNPMADSLIRSMKEQGLSPDLARQATEAAQAQPAMPVAEPEVPTDDMRAAAATENAQDEESYSEIVAARKRIFSPKLKNTVEAEKLDRLYHSLENYLWDISEITILHQNALMTLMEPKKFQYTRRHTEFKPTLAKAMTELNKSRNNFKAFIEKNNQEFEVIKPAFGEEQEAAEALWKETIGAFEKRTNEYFKSQNKYLNLYNKLVSYIMARAGGYYYNSTANKIAFYKVEEYTFFGETLDKLNKIAYAQKQSLSDIKPAKLAE